MATGVAGPMHERNDIFWTVDSGRRAYSRHQWLAPNNGGETAWEFPSHTREEEVYT
jgi:hypothetical protein